jgi:hypothetical protein
MRDVVRSLRGIEPAPVDDSEVRTFTLLRMAIPPFTQHSMHTAARHDGQEARFDRLIVVFDFSRIIDQMAGGIVHFDIVPVID